MKPANNEIKSLENVKEMMEAREKSNQIKIDKTKLPSRGVNYVADMFARKLKPREVKNLSKVTTENADATFNKIIGDCITGIDLNDICLNDKLWLIYYLRSITYDDMPYKVKHTCSKCGTENNYDYTMDKLVVKRSENVLPEEIKLPNGDRIKPRYPTIGDEIQINRLKNDPNIIDIIDSEIITITAHIDTINGKKVSLYDAYQYFADEGKGTTMDFVVFCNEMNKYVFAAFPQFEIDCDCGNRMTINVPLAADFFVPTIK